MWIELTAKMQNHIMQWPADGKKTRGFEKKQALTTLSVSYRTGLHAGEFTTSLFTTAVTARMFVTRHPARYT
jgi:hypothetical protein